MDVSSPFKTRFSRAIAAKLEVKLSVGRAVVTSRTNIEAYNLYLRGRHQFDKRNPAAYSQAGDPIAAPWRRTPGSRRRSQVLADCLTIGVLYGSRNPAQAIPEARKLLERALLMDVNLPETHTSLGISGTVYCSISERPRSTSFDRIN